MSNPNDEVTTESSSQNEPTTTLATQGAPERDESDATITNERATVEQSNSFSSLPSDRPDRQEQGEESGDDNDDDDDDLNMMTDDDDENPGESRQRVRFDSADFHRFMSRHEALEPMNSRRSELPTFYRPFYTGVWYKDIRTHCYPHGWNKYCWPLLLSFLAEVFTIWGSFSCQYFRGASIGFTGGRYGLWTLEDSHGKCQLWSVLFYSLDLGSPLRFSRVFSMSAMVLGLAVLTTMAQAMQCHAISYGIGLILFLVFLVSVSTTSTFNIWIVWALFNYFLFVIIVRAAFVHPVARRISKRGCQYIAACQVLCHVFTILTLVVLKSDFCTCDSLSPGELEGRILEHEDPCEGVCGLHLSGYMVICASAMWLGASWATLRIGIQPDRLYVARPPEQFAYYSRESFTTRAIKLRKTLASPFAARKSTVDSMSAMGTSDETGQSTRDSRSDGEENDHQTSHKVSFPGLDTTTPQTPGSMVDNGDNNDEDDDDMSWHPQRSKCQVCCCDFRITPRSRNEKILFWSFRFALGFIFSLYIFLVIVMIGQRVENLTAQEAPSTSPYFITDVVCAFDPLDTAKPFRTFANKQGAIDAGWKVAHCGACSDCSNMPDIQTYVETRKTIAQSVKQCGPTNYLGTFDELVECLQDRIDFTDKCTICWAENVRNTGRDCLFTCLHTLFTGFMASNNVAGAGSKGWLNHCLYCDEKLSGPAFVTCSGVSRRRLGIVSEIERNPLEQCRMVDIDWVSVDFEALRTDDMGKI